MKDERGTMNGESEQGDLSAYSSFIISTGARGKPPRLFER
jgi:hypothetical protein